MSQATAPETSTKKTDPKRNKRRPRRVKVPSLLQMEATECGAASLGMILAHYGKYVPLEQLRADCGVSRDGSKASNVLKSARYHGMVAKGYRLEVEDLKSRQGPAIIHWNFNHFLVYEGYKGDKVFLNDPASGSRTVSSEEFDRSFTGVAMFIEPGPEFNKEGSKPSVIRALAARLKGSRQALTYVVLTGLMLVIPGLVIPTFSRVFIDEILVGGKTSWLTGLLVGLAATGLMQAILTWLQQHYLLRLETKIALTSSAKFFWHVLRLPAEFFTQRYAGDISHRVSSNDRVATLLSRELASSVLSAFMIVFYFFLMLRFDVLLTLVGVGAVVINMAFLKFISRRRIDQNMRLLQERGKLMGTAMGGLQIIETLKATGSETDFFARWAGYHARVMGTEQEIGRSSQFLMTIPTLLTGLTNVAVLILGAYRVLDGHLTMGMLVAFQSLMFSFLRPVTDIMNLGGTLQEVEGDLQRLDDVLRYPAEDVAHQADTPPSIGAKLSGHLQIKDLSFGYSRLEPALVEDFNLDLKPGRRVALVGGSGSGKSTIARLVTGLYQPWSGEILFDGKSRQQIPRHVLNNSLSFVAQDISMFEGTIKDNLTLWDNTASELDIIRAAKDAMIHDDITAKEGGYEYVVEEGGNNFSGGQRQRMEIARSLVTNPTILVMDEATSALDPRTEKLVDENIRRRGCTCLIVAHRLSTIRDCDEIIVLKHGKIVQRGTHDQLKAEEGEYARLIEVPQSSGGGNANA